MFTGLVSIPVWQLVGLGLILTHITIASVTIFLHRHQAHRALELHPIMSHFFRFWLWFTTGMITKEWVAVHRKHHAKCETAEDPHSPQVLGIIKVLREGADLYVKETENPQTLEKYGYGVPNDWLERNLYSRYHHLGLGILLALELVSFGPLGLTLWAVQMLWIPFWAAGVVNGLGHYLGYRNFETLDASTNISPLGILIGGEELHNNHHAYPASAKLSSQWWEFDIGWLYIRLMAMVKLAQVKRIAPEINIDWGKSIADAETVLAVLKNRVHVMALYSRSVIIPVLRFESRCADSTTRKVLKKARPLVVGQYLRSDGGMNGVLQRALEASQTLATVYRFKQQLSELWTNASLSQEHRLEALREWCRQAQETQIQCLQHFAQTLRGYSVSEPNFS